MTLGIDHGHEVGQSARPFRVHFYATEFYVAVRCVGPSGRRDWSADHRYTCVAGPGVPAGADRVCVEPGGAEPARGVLRPGPWGGEGWLAGRPSVTRSGLKRLMDPVRVSCFRLPLPWVAKIGHSGLIGTDGADFSLSPARSFLE